MQVFNHLLFLPLGHSWPHGSEQARSGRETRPTADTACPTTRACCTPPITTAIITMLSRTLRQAAVKGARMASTKRSSINGPGAFESAYQIFMKNNVTYVGTILLAAVVVEGVYGSVTNAIWESSNRGVRTRCVLACVLWLASRTTASLTHYRLCSVVHSGGPSIHRPWLMHVVIHSACTTTSTGASSRATTTMRRRRRTTSKVLRPSIYPQSSRASDCRRRMRVSVHVSSADEPELLALARVRAC